MKVSFLQAAVTSVAIGVSAASQADFDPMLKGLDGYTVLDPLLTIGESISGYTPPGILDGLGAYKINGNTVRVLANHELLHFRGYPYQLANGAELTGARISYFDIDTYSYQIKDAGLAYDKIYDANGNLATDNTFLGSTYAPAFEGPEAAEQLQGLSRFCSSVSVQAGEFNKFPGYTRKHGFDFGPEDDIYFTGEENGGGFDSVGGALWALDVRGKALWQVPMFGRGAWENITAIDTGSRRTVAYILADDSSPFDADNMGPGTGDGVNEAAPLYLYLGHKARKGNFLERNGLAYGKLYVLVISDTVRKPSDFNSAGTMNARWVEIDNSQDLSQASQDGSTGYDEYGYPTQRTLWKRADALQTFGFSRPEDVAYKPNNPRVAVLASTGVDNYDIDSETGNGVDTFGTLYTVKTNFNNLSAKISILYDGDADLTRNLRSPDNLDWADDNRIYVQEDEAEEDTASGDEVLFGPDATNPYEASIVVVDPKTGATRTIAEVDRSVVLDASIATPTDAVDTDAGAAGEWESSGILDVSKLFGKKGGSLFVLDVQAHGIEDQDQFNPASRIHDFDLVEGGQLLLLQKD